MILDSKMIERGLQTIILAQRAISGQVPGALDGDRRATVDAAYALIAEIHETVNETNWKPWKAQALPKPDRIIEEFADVLAFLGVFAINLAESCDMTPDLFVKKVAEQYYKTSFANLERFRNGVEDADVRHDTLPSPTEAEELQQARISLTEATANIIRAFTAGLSTVLDQVEEVVTAPEDEDLEAVAYGSCDLCDEQALILLRHYRVPGGLIILCGKCASKAHRWQWLP